MPSHPLVKHWLAVARNKLSPPAVFRGALAELGRLLIYEASAEEGWLPVLEGQAETPCGIADVAFLDPGRPIKASTHSLCSKSISNWVVCVHRSPGRQEQHLLPLLSFSSHLDSRFCQIRAGG